MTDSQILTLAKRFHTGGRENGYIVPIRKIADAPVSYTHLTLPTIYSV